MQIVLAKSISGEYFIGKLTDKDNHPILTNAYGVHIHPNPQNPNSLTTTIIPLMFPFDDKAIKEISMNILLAVIDAPEELQNTYIKITTGIDVVKANTKIIQ
jgi:hypothetical protein